MPVRVLVISAVYLVLVMFTLGLELGREPRVRLTRKEKAKKTRILLRGLAFNVVVMPLVALGLVHALGSTGDVTTALLLLAATPGGRYAPLLARIAEADLATSIELTLLLVKVTVLTGPLTAGWLLGTQRASVPGLRIVLALLVLQVVPLLLGRTMRQRHARLAGRLERPAAKLVDALTAGIFFLVVAEIGVRRVSLFVDRGWVAVLVFAVVAAVLGALLGGPASATRHTFAIGANARNLPLALLICTSTGLGPGVRLAAIAVWIVLVLASAGYAVSSHAMTKRTAASA